MTLTLSIRCGQTLTKLSLPTHHPRAKMALAVVLALSALLSSSQAQTRMANLTAAQIVVGDPGTPLMYTAASMLSDQVFQRTGLRWPVVNSTTRANGVVHISAHSPLEVDRSSPKAEGYTVDVNVSQAGPLLTITGTDGRGVL